ncbi:MAG: ATP-binding protein [Candidatus Krumholzibacteriia bacterium]
MTLTIRLLSILILIMLVLLAVDSVLLVRRDEQLFDHDMQRDATQLGRVLADVVSDAWRSRGDAAAQQLVARLNEEHETVDVSWVRLDGRTADAAPAALIPLIARARMRDRIVSTRERDGTGREQRFTIVPLDGPGDSDAVLVITEPLAELAAQSRRTIVRSLTLGGLTILAGVILLLTFGMRMVGLPLRELVAKTERIGAGDLGGDLVLEGRDELTDLAHAMNRMCENLAAAREDARQKSEARVAALEQLRHSERLAMLGSLSSGLAHELGTPLNVVAGRAKMISGGQLAPDAITESALIIRSQADRMTALVRQFLDYARRGSTTPAPVDLGDLAARCLEMLRMAARKAGVELRLDAPGPLPLVMVDRVQMEQVLMNLVMNGIQAMPRGGTLEVRLAVEPDGRLAMHVVDEGVGIPPEHLAQVCEPFFTTKQTGQGTGLGLSIVKGIVDDNGGSLELASEVGRGTVVTVRLAAAEVAS